MGLKDKPGITIQNCSSQHVWVLAHADPQELRTKHLNFSMANGEIGHDREALGKCPVQKHPLWPGWNTTFDCFHGDTLYITILDAAGRIVKYK